MSNADPLPDVNRGEPYIHYTQQFLAMNDLVAKLYVNNDKHQDLLMFVQLPAIPAVGDMLVVRLQMNAQNTSVRVLQVLHQFERPPMFGPDRRMLSLVVEVEE